MVPQHRDIKAGIANLLMSWVMLLPTFEMLQGSPGSFLELPEEYITIDMAACHYVTLHSINVISRLDTPNCIQHVSATSCRLSQQVRALQ